MKKLTLTTFALFAILCANIANAYTIEKVGTVKTMVYNDMLKRVLFKDVDVWVGITEEGEDRIILKVDTGLKQVQLYFDPLGTSYQYFLNGVNKTVEWGEIAKQNSVDISKGFGNDRYNNCGVWSAKCNISFTAYSDGKFSAMRFYVEDTNNQFYNQQSMIGDDQITLLKELLEVQVPIALQKRRDAISDDPADVAALFN